MSDKTLDDIKDLAQRLTALYSARDAMYLELRQMLHMEWQDPPTGDWIKATMSPSAYNAVIGAVRLMVSTEPGVNVPFDEAHADAKNVSSRMEQACKAMWSGAGRVAQRPVHYEVVFSAIMFAEICGSVTRTADLLRYAEGSGDKAQIARMKHVAAQTPYMFHIYNPIHCYGDFDLYGLRGMLRKAPTTWAECKATWGKLAEESVSGKFITDHKEYDPVTLYDWWDWEYRAVWVDGADQAILLKPHGLEFLPVVDQVVDGTMLFDRPELQRFPLLYAMWKSELWKRENLGLTTMYSLIHALGANPLTQQETDDPDKPLVIDRTVPGGTVKVAKGERLSPLLEKVVDPEQYKGLEMARQINEESTIPKMALGAPPQQLMAFSAISLLTQSGRLPLVATKQMGGEAIANLLIAALTWYKSDPPQGGKFYDAGKGNYIEITSQEIPDRIALRVNLEPDLPTDKLQLANTGLALKQAHPPLASDRWIRENILSVGQSEQMDKEIWMEQRIVFEIKRLFDQMSAQDQMKIQAMAAQMQAQQMQPSASSGGLPPPNGSAPQGGPGGIPGTPPGSGGPPVTPYPAGGTSTGSVGEGQPAAGPLPPRWQAR